VSTGWGWRCRTCSSNETIDGFDCADAAKVLPWAPALGVLGRAMNGSSEYQFKRWGCGTVIDLEWFAAHGDHALAVVDEYGRANGQCTHWLRSGPCALGEGHEGEHATWP
jgi:hypothetical protein